MSFSVGALVRARGREWVVLPQSKLPDLLVLRPLGGTDDEIAGIYTKLEDVTSARFELPNPETDLGNHRSGRLLRDAVQLSFRSGAGPFRSLGRISVEPRPYQIVPLLMALRLDPVRLLIADDVGIGKTVEALLIARELLDRGEIQRTCVLCPPHLAEQWQVALKTQFQIDATLVLSSTAARLEKQLQGESIFERHDHTIVSMDFIKSERRRETFIRTCPELVIVDEAHGCADTTGKGKSQQLRHEVLRRLSDPEDANAKTRHMLLVTATPHSGKEDAFRSLLAVLDRKFATLPASITAEKDRRELAKHFVQRRRGDVKQYVGEDTVFPEREQTDTTYQLSKPYLELFDSIVEYLAETVADEKLSKQRRRVRFWSALALLRALGSSPAAAAMTLRKRAAYADSEDDAQTDEAGRAAVFDRDDAELEGTDVVGGSQTEASEDEHTKKLLEFAGAADELQGTKTDKKLAGIKKIVKGLIDEGFHPIVFCKFIATADYVGKELASLPSTLNAQVETVTGGLPPEAREERIARLGKHTGARVLVCTDCLSEGINLQEPFNAVVHYDLSWNPTRHEQREGRVDRYGQRSPTVRTLTYYGKNNPIDERILDVLLRKHGQIYKQLGISVPVPGNTEDVVASLIEEMLLKKKKEQLGFDFADKDPEQFEIDWDAAVEREKKSRTRYAQHAIKVEEVTPELEAIREALGGPETVKRFTLDAFRSLGAAVGHRTDHHQVDLKETPAGLRDHIGESTSLKLSFREPVPRDGELLTRPHPIVEGLASFVVETALDTALEGPGKRCAVVRAASVPSRSTLLLVRFRFLIQEPGKSPLLAEDAHVLGFRGKPSDSDWLDDLEVDELLEKTEPSDNVPADLARRQLEKVLSGLGALGPHLEQIAKERAEHLRQAHVRVRHALAQRAKSYKVEPHPPDLMGVYMYLPGDAK